MQQRRGFALVLALAVMMVLIGVIFALAVSTIGDLRQSRTSVQHLQALAAAEAGETYAEYVLSDLAQPEFRAIFMPYSTNFLAQGGNPANDWVIPENKWATVANQLETLLNTNHGTLPSGALQNGASVAIHYRVLDFRGATRSATAQTYMAEFQVRSVASLNRARRRVASKGYMKIQIGRPSLSQWLFLVDDAGGSGGFFPTGSVFNGPVHANHNWGFWGQPIFKGVASTADDGAWYWHLGGDGCSGAQRKWITGDSRPPCTVPIFQKGFVRNAPEIQLPQSAVSQERAALGLDPIQDQDHDGVPDPVTNQERCQALFGTSSCTVNRGVYLVHKNGQVTGGIYVKGPVKRLTLKASGDGKQIYTFKIKKNGVMHRWTITVDYQANTTEITEERRKSGGGWKVLSTASYSGTPNGHAALGSGGPTGQIYVNGTVEKLTGPGRSGAMPCGSDYPGSADDCPDHPPPDVIQPALSLETQLTITATGEIGLWGDLVYECDPTQLANSSYLSQHPRCNLNGQPLKTVLGVMSASQNVTILDGAPDNIYLWGSYLSGAPGKGLAVENYGSRGPQGKMRLFGGLIQSADKLRGTIGWNGQLTSGYIETYDYDRRFADSKLVPPNFPTARYFSVQKLIPIPLSYREY